jgi:hypothetical protein
VLDEDHRALAIGEDAAQRLANERGAVRVEVRGRLVEQEQLGAEREDAGEREALLLAAG